MDERIAKMLLVMAEPVRQRLLNSQRPIRRSGSTDAEYYGMTGRYLSDLYNGIEALKEVVSNRENARAVDHITDYTWEAFRRDPLSAIQASKKGTVIVHHPDGERVTVITTTTVDEKTSTRES